MKKGFGKLIGIILVVLCVVAIWGFALKSGKASHQQSGTTEIVLEKVLNKLNIKVDKKYYKVFAPFVEDPNNITTEDAIRKAAHFTEYFVLGLLCALMAIAYRHGKPCILFTLLGIGISYIDERVIQLHIVAGRTSSFRDILLDCCGYYIAFLAITLLGVILLQIKRLVTFKRR